MAKRLNKFNDNLKNLAEKTTKGGKGFIGEFRTFITRGNVFDLAIGVIIGGAFQTIVSSLVNDMIMPVISIITGGLDFSEWFISLNGIKYSSLAEAQAAGAATLNFGSFMTAVLNFLIMAFVIFMLIKTINTLSERFTKKDENEEKKTKKCPFCCTEIDINATRCPNCTSELKEDEPEKK